MNYPGQKLRILHLEDLPTDAELIARELKKGGLDFEIKWVDNENDFARALTEFPADIILSDHSLPSFDSLGALKIVKDHNIHIPFILITASTSEEIAVSVMKAGAWDYILKDRLQRLPQAVIQVTEKYQAERERKLAEDELRSTHEKLFFHIENSPLGFIEWNPDFSVKFSSTRAEEIFGWNDRDIENGIQGFDMIYEEDREWVEQEAVDMLKRKSLIEGNHLVHRSYTKDRQVIWCEWYNSMTRNEEGKITSMMSLVSNITEQKKIESELLQSELRLRDFFENAPEAITIHDISTTNTVAFNNNALKLLKYSADDLLRKTPIDLSPPTQPDGRETTERMGELIGAVIQGDKPIFEWMIRDAEGKDTLCEVRLNHLPGNQIIASFTDITARKATEKILHNYNDRYKAVSRATNDAVWDWNILTDHELWNHGLETIFGYPMNEINSARTWWKEKIHPSDYEKVNQLLEGAFSSRQTNWTCEYRYLCANGRYKYVLDRAYIMYDGNSPIRMIGAMQDVTELVEYRLGLEKMVEKRTNELNDALKNEKESVEMKSRFVSIASHEFRTPLSTISLAAGFVRKYKNNIASEEIDRRLDNIQKQVLHMSTLLDDILTVGKADAGKIKVNLSKLKIKQLFEELALETSRSKGKSHRINLHLECTQEYVWTDEGLMRNIIINLLTNAIKFSPESKEVDFTAILQNDLLTIRVRDKGVGIPEEDMKNLFEAFFRSKNVSTISGTGLGLSIVKKAVLLLDGEIKVKSKINEGTEFIVTLPIKDEKENTVG